MSKLKKTKLSKQRPRLPPISEMDEIKEEIRQYEEEREQRREQKRQEREQRREQKRQARLPQRQKSFIYPDIVYALLHSNKVLNQSDKVRLHNIQEVYYNKNINLTDEQRRKLYLEKERLEKKILEEEIKNKRGKIEPLDLTDVGVPIITGAAIGSLGGPLSPITVPIGAAVGAAVGVATLNKKIKKRKEKEEEKKNNKKIYKGG